MIRKLILLICTVVSVLARGQDSDVNSVYVKNSTELNEAISNVTPGDEIVMADGNWNDVQIKFVGYGYEQQPITLKAETSGKVILQGKSNLKLGGEYLVVEGLYFTNGATPSDAVIEFAVHRDTVANHSRVTDCAIIDYNQPQRNQGDLWVLLKGRHNELNQCYLAGKSNRGPTVRVDLAGNRSIKNYHKITNNHFGPRPPKGGPSAETIQIGNSFTSMAPSYTLVANNLFDHCDGEVEVISSKSNFNEFRNNVFYKSEGSLVTRHGNYCTIDGNYFFGDENSEQIGGIRLIGTGHWVTNNYFYDLMGNTFRSPLAVMNGIPKSPLNRYLQVTDVVVAYNSWINCSSPWQFGVGSNVDQKDILPASEIRSETPIRTIVANNLIHNEKGGLQPIVAYDSLNGIDFESNLINNQGIAFAHDSLLKQEDFSMVELEENVLVPSDDLPQLDLYDGFEFDRITEDVFGNSRKQSNQVGAIAGPPAKEFNIMDTSQYGPDWHPLKSSENNRPQNHPVGSTAEFKSAVQEAESGDTILLTANRYKLKSPLKIDKRLTIKSATADQRINLQFNGAGKTPAFEMHPKGELNLMSVALSGNKENYAFASLEKNMSSLYNLSITDSEISDFEYVLKGYKNSFAEHIEFKSTTIKNCTNGLELSAETDDRGEYNAENLIVENCRFEGIDKNIIDYYRGGYDESTVGGNLVVTNSIFTHCGAEEENGILINTYGIINAKITGNKFIDNEIKLVARLWGAKNNSHSGNTIENSGELVVEQNLPLKMMY